MARHVGEPGRADPEATAELPADGPGDDEHLHAAPEHPGLLPLWAGRAAAANPSAEGLPPAGPTTAASLPGDDPGSAEYLHAALQYPSLLCPGRFTERSVPDRGL